MKRYIILICVLLCALFCAGCAGGCNSCKTTITPPSIETDATEPKETEPPEEPNYIGIGLQEPKYIDLPDHQSLSADQAFDALLRHAMTTNEYRPDANKYYQFAINGQTGKLAGTPPFDTKKGILFSAGIGLLASVLLGIIMIVGGIV